MHFVHFESLTDIFQLVIGFNFLELAPFAEKTIIIIIVVYFIFSDKMPANYYYYVTYTSNDYTRKS